MMTRRQCLRRRTLRLRHRSDRFGTLASLFSPFWYLDAKGGEVVLFRVHVGFAWVGHKLLAFSFVVMSLCLCIFYLLNSMMCGVRHTTCEPTSMSLCYHLWFVDKHAHI